MVQYERGRDWISVSFLPSPAVPKLLRIHLVLVLSSLNLLMKRGWTGHLKVSYLVLQFLVCVRNTKRTFLASGLSPLILVIIIFFDARNGLDRRKFLSLPIPELLSSTYRHLFVMLSVSWWVPYLSFFIPRMSPPTPNFHHPWSSGAVEGHHTEDHILVTTLQL